MLADFSFTPPEQIFAELQEGSGMPAMAAAPAATPQPCGMTRQWRRWRQAWRCGAAKPDLNDVKYDAFLANDRTLADPEVVKVEPGGRVLLRVINSSSMSAYPPRSRRARWRADRGGRVPGRSRSRAAASRSRSRSGSTSASRFRARRLPIPCSRARGRAQPDRHHPARRDAPIARIPDRPRRLARAHARSGEPPARRRSRCKPRKADRVHTLNLTGEMAGYVWSINNVAWNKDVPPLPIAKGERVELVFVEPDPDAASDAPARARVSGRRDRRQALCRRGARHGAGPARTRGSWSPSTPTIRGCGRFIATCSTTSTPECSRPCATSDGANRADNRTTRDRSIAGVVAGHSASKDARKRAYAGNPWFS